jgi:hypothetical protein
MVSLFSWSVSGNGYSVWVPIEMRAPLQLARYVCVRRATGSGRSGEQGYMSCSTMA